MTQTEAFIVEIQTEFPLFRILPKTSSPWMKFIDLVLRVISFGKNKNFLVNYVTTIGNTVYTCQNWDLYDDDQKIVLLRHERIHLRQARRMGKFWFSLYYIFPFIPLFFAYGRTHLEMEAYEESIRATIQFRGTAYVLRTQYKQMIMDQFTTGAYLWMWIYKPYIEKWFDAARERAIDDYISQGKEK